MSGSATAISHANIALVKYWGKRDAVLNLPRNGSISATLQALQTETAVTVNEETAELQLVIDGTRQAGRSLAKAVRVWDALCQRAGRRVGATIVSTNSFPSASGLASSASGLSALTVAGAAALGLRLSVGELSAIARQGSGSACRSLYGGFVEWARGEEADGSDSTARQLLPEGGWDVRWLVVLVGDEPKATSSTDAMEATVSHSLLYDAFDSLVDMHLPQARQAIGQRDLDALGCLAEQSCLAMHAAMWVSTRPIFYWHGPTAEVIRKVLRLRQQGCQCYFTIDAGPHVKILTTPQFEDVVAQRVGSIAGVQRIIPSRLGPGPHVLSAAEADPSHNRQRDPSGEAL